MFTWQHEGFRLITEKNIGPLALVFLHPHLHHWIKLRALLTLSREPCTVDTDETTIFCWPSDQTWLAVKSPQWKCEWEKIMYK